MMTWNAIEMLYGKQNISPAGNLILLKKLREVYDLATILKCNVPWFSENTHFDYWSMMLHVLNDEYRFQSWLKRDFLEDFEIKRTEITMLSGHNTWGQWLTEEFVKHMDSYNNDSTYLELRDRQPTITTTVNDINWVNVSTDLKVRYQTLQNLWDMIEFEEWTIRIQARKALNEHFFHYSIIPQTDWTIKLEKDNPLFNATIDVYYIDPKNSTYCYINSKDWKLSDRKKIFPQKHKDGYYEKNSEGEYEWIIHKAQNREWDRYEQSRWKHFSPLDWAKLTVIGNKTIAENTATRSDHTNETTIWNNSLPSWDIAKLYSGKTTIAPINYEDIKKTKNSCILNLRWNWSFHSSSFDFLHERENLQYLKILFPENAVALDPTILNSLGKLQNLKTLAIENYPDSIFSESFLQLTDIKELIVTGTKVKQLPEDIFKKLSKIRSLSLITPNINKVPDGLFDLDLLILELSIGVKDNESFSGWAKTIWKSHFANRNFSYEINNLKNLSTLKLTFVASDDCPDFRISIPLDRTKLSNLKQILVYVKSDNEMWYNEVRLPAEFNQMNALGLTKIYRQTDNNVLYTPNGMLTEVHDRMRDWFGQDNFQMGPLINEQSNRTFTPIYQEVNHQENIFALYVWTDALDISSKHSPAFYANINDIAHLLEKWFNKEGEPVFFIKPFAMKIGDGKSFSIYDITKEWLAEYLSPYAPWITLSILVDGSRKQLDSRTWYFLTCLIHSSRPLYSMKNQQNRAFSDSIREFKKTAIDTEKKTLQKNATDKSRNERHSAREAFFAQYEHFRARHFSPIEYKPDNADVNYTKEELEALADDPQRELMFGHSGYLPAIRYDSASSKWTLIPHKPIFKEIKNLSSKAQLDRDDEKLEQYLGKIPGGQRLKQLAQWWEEYLCLPYATKLLAVNAISLDSSRSVPIQVFRDEDADMTKVTWDHKSYGWVVRLTVIYKVPTLNTINADDRKSLTGNYISIDTSLLHWDNSFSAKMIREILLDTKTNPKNWDEYQVSSFFHACHKVINDRFDRESDNELNKLYLKSKNIYDSFEEHTLLDCDQNVLYGLERLFEKIWVPVKWRVWELVNWKGLKYAAHAWFEISIDNKTYPIDLTPSR